MGKTIIFFVDLALILLLTWRVVEINNDKMYIAFIFGYGAIMVFNLILWAILGLFKSAMAKDFGKIIIGLIILFIPLVFFVSRS